MSLLIEPERNWNIFLYMTSSLLLSSFNRTGKELKLTTNAFTLVRNELLIEPERNWNTINPIDHFSGNLLLIEPERNWNFINLRCVYFFFVTFNRTGKELKQDNYFIEVRAEYLLIEPERNWNRPPDMDTFHNILFF